MKKIAFLKTFLKDVRVASVTPTSKGSVRKMCDLLPLGVENEVVVEYGPGSGVVSRELLARLAPTGTLVLIEQNAAFAKDVKSQFSDARVRVVEGSAVDVDAILHNLQLDHVSVAVSSIPFTLLSPEAADAVVQKTHALLSPGGVFLVFQFTPKAKKFLKRYFPKIATHVMAANVPPLTVWTMERR